MDTRDTRWIFASKATLASSMRIARIYIHKASLLLASGFLFFLVATGISVAQVEKDKAWQILQTGSADKSVDKRTMAIRVLGILPNNASAVDLAEKALADERPEVRSAAALALGEMESRNSAPKLHEALKDKEAVVVMSAAASLKRLGDPMAYEVYYAILTGNRKGGGGLLDDQRKMLKDPKKMAQFGFDQGIGFVPFAGAGLQAVKAFTKDDTSPVRAGAAKALASDPDPHSGEALVAAVADKSPIVRAAAIEAIAQRGDPSLLANIYPAMDDDKDVVRFTAAAAVVRLAAAGEKPKTDAKQKH